MEPYDTVTAVKLCILYIPTVEQQLRKADNYWKLFNPYDRPRLLGDTEFFTEQEKVKCLRRLNSFDAFRAVHLSTALARFQLLYGPTHFKCQAFGSKLASALWVRLWM